MFRRRAGRRREQVEHWSGRKPRDLEKPIPKDTDAIVVVLDRVSHALMKKVRIEASQRGLPLYFQRRGRRIESSVRRDMKSLDIFLQYQDVP
jgi:hypothetical protein